MNIQNLADIKYHFDFFVNEITDEKLKRVCLEILNYEDFWNWTASKGKHHCFEKGLVIHTLEVTEIALHTSKIFENCNDDILITACLWHDLAKIWEYKKRFDDEGKFQFWDKTDYHGKIHHISGSTAEFTAVAMKYDVDRETIQKVQHCIVSHHGRPEWGSPRIPESVEALILHQSDMLSAMYPQHTDTPIEKKHE